MGACVGGGSLRVVPRHSSAPLLRNAATRIREAALPTVAHAERIGPESDADDAAHGTNASPERQRASQASEAAFEAFFTRHEQPLYGYLRRLVSTDEIAVELSQEAFFRAWTHFAEIQTYERPEAWLYRVATNLAISHLRRRRPLPFTQVFKRGGGETESNDASDDQDFFADPLDVERQTTDRDLISQVLRRLPERQRAALLLRAVQGFSGEEVAEALGISLPNARQTLSRGREKFRRLYEAALRECESPS